MCLAGRKTNKISVRRRTARSHPKILMLDYVSESSRNLPLGLRTQSILRCSLLPRWSVLMLSCRSVNDGFTASIMCRPLPFRYKPDPDTGFSHVYFRGHLIIERFKQSVGISGIFLILFTFRGIYSATRKRRSTVYSRSNVLGVRLLYPLA